MRDSREECRPDPVALLEDSRALGELGDLINLQDDGEVRGKGGQDATVMRVQGRAPERQHELAGDIGGRGGRFHRGGRLRSQGPRGAPRTVPQPAQQCRGVDREGLAEKV